MKIKIKLTTIIAVILILTAVAAAAFYLQKFDLRIFTKEKSSSSEIILTHINEIYNLSSVEYVYKTVFPFDFYNKDMDWYSLLKKRSRGEPLTEEEQKQTDFYDLCREAGIPLDRSNYRFVVITSLIKAGVSSVNLIGKDDLMIEGSSITIKLPPTGITEFIIEDNSSNDYHYPDLPMDPLHWKRITDFVKPEIKKRVLKAGILKEAEARLEDFLSSLLHESGFESVEFIR